MLTLKCLPSEVSLGSAENIGIIGNRKRVINKYGIGQSGHALCCGVVDRDVWFSAHGECGYFDWRAFAFTNPMLTSTQEGSICGI